MIYRLSHGQNGSAFSNIGRFDLDKFPVRLRLLAEYLRENPDVVDLCVTRAGGSNLVIRREELGEMPGVRALRDGIEAAGEGMGI